MRSVSHLIAVAGAVICLGSLHESSVTADTLMTVSGSFSSVLDNTEYFNRYRVGETLFSTRLKGRLTLHPIPDASFSGGLMVRKETGDENFLSDIRPLFRAEYHHAGFSFLLGELYGTENNHGMPAPMLLEQRKYRPGVEEGIQLRGTRGRLSQDFFVDYPLLDTRDHQEQIRIGNALRWMGKFGGVDGYLYAAHHGGQLNQHNEPVRWNTTASAGGVLKHPFEGKVSEIGISEHVVGSKTDHDTLSLQSSRGYGSLTEVWATLFGCRVAATAWFGHNYTTWYGDPLYKADTYYHLELTRHTVFPKNVFFDAGVRLCWVDVPLAQYGENNDSRFWFELGWEPTYGFVGRSLRNN